MLAKKASLHDFAAVDKAGRSLLHFALQSDGGMTVDVFNSVIKKLWHVRHQQDRDGISPVMIAAQRGHLFAVRCLLGADAPLQKDKDGPNNNASCCHRRQSESG